MGNIESQGAGEGVQRSVQDVGRSEGNARNSNSISTNAQHTQSDDIVYVGGGTSAAAAAAAGGGGGEASAMAQVHNTGVNGDSTEPQASSLPIPTTAANGSLDEIRRLLTIVDELEGELRLKRSQLSTMQIQMQGNILNKKEQVDAQEEMLAVQLETLTAEAKARYSEALHELNMQRDAELQASIKHVGTVLLEERRRMSREDAHSFVFRELEEAWKMAHQELQTKHERDLQLHLTIASETHEKLFREMVNKFDQEMRQAQETVEESKRDRRKRSSIFSFLSPGTKKSKREGAEDSDSDED